jgi:hypothetical protein
VKKSCLSDKNCVRDKSISCFPPFQISFVMSICSRFVSVSLQCHRMWSVVRLTAQKRHFGLGSLSSTAAWVALVYPVRKQLMTTCSRPVIFSVFVFIMWCGLRSFMVVVELSHFSCCSCSCFSFIHAIKSCGGYVLVWCFRSVLLLLRRRLLRFQVCDSEPIVM